jgi:Uma2 family endonuclease
MATLILGLRHYFRRHSNVYVIGNIFLYYEEGHPESRQSPDVMVIKGVDGNWERPSFKIWEERAVPNVVIEITSLETAEEDQEAKRLLYERLGIREFFLFDPLHEYLERPLIGYRLIGEEYEPLPPAADGGLLSAELGLRLVPEEMQLTLIHFRTGERIPTPPELAGMVEAEQARAAVAEQQAVAVQQQAVAAQQQAVAAQQQAIEAEKRADEAAQRALNAEDRAAGAEQHASQVEQQLEQERRRREQLEAELARLRVAQSPPGEAGPSS